MKHGKLRMVFGIHSLLDKSLILNDWDKVKIDINSLDTDLKDVIELRFKQMKCIVLRKGLIDELDSRYPGWYHQMPYDVVQGYKYYFNHDEVFKSNFHRAISIWENYLIKRYDFNKLDGSIWELLFCGYLNVYGNMYEPVKSIAHFLDHKSMKNSLSKDRHYRHSGVFIHIKRPISKNQLKNYIDEYWTELSNVLNKLPESTGSQNLPTFRDLEIVELRDCFGKTFPEIADEIIARYKFSNEEGGINEDSVKTAYHRTHLRLVD